MDKKHIKLDKPLISSDDEITARFKEEGPWGLSLALDLHDCNPKKIRDAKFIKNFFKDLVKFIEMREYGEAKVVDFGDDPRVSGFSAFQFIQTSSIVAHFANHTNSIYMDIFSCKEYRPHEAAAFCKKYFDATQMSLNIVFRE